MALTFHMPITVLCLICGVPVALFSFMSWRTPAEDAVVVDPGPHRSGMLMILGVVAMVYQ